MALVGLGIMSDGDQTRSEALTALRHFLSRRLDAFGPTEDAMLSADPWMAHSTLSPVLNLGLLHPLECAEAAVRDMGSCICRIHHSDAGTS